VVVGIYLAVTCSSNDPAEGCALPMPGSEEFALVEDATSQAEFDLVYPCFLPNAQTLESTAVTGEPGRQAVSFVWVGPFEFTVRQSQFPPAVAPDPSGASRTGLNLFPNVRAELIERNDGSGDAMYHLFWQEDDIYYELQAFGPAQQRRTILQIARSLEEYPGQQARSNEEQGKAEEARDYLLVMD
jgi:hypothetical protein